MEATKQLVLSVPTLTLVAIVLWWMGNVIATVATKKALLTEAIPGGEIWTEFFADLRWVDISALQHVCGALLAVIWLKVAQKPLFPDNIRSTASALCVAAAGHLLGTLTTNAAYVLSSYNTVLVVKASEPLITLLLSMGLYRDHIALNVSAFLSVVMAVIGAVTFMTQGVSFSIAALILGIISSVVFPVRNIFLRNLSSVWDSPVQKFAAMSMIGSLVLLPLSAVKLLYSLPVVNPTAAVVSAVAHSLYNMASVTVLESMSPVTHALLNLFKRAFVVLVSVAYYRDYVSWTLIVSLALVLVGCYFYFASFTYKNKYLPLKTLILLVYLVYVMMSYSSVLLRETGKNINSAASTRISTSWVFDRDMPQSVVANIHVLAQTNPHCPVYVYCGTTQCVQALANSEQGHDLRVQFLDAMDLVRDTPLEQWMMRHPLHKLLSGRAFETHLHQVVKLGLLLKHGGIYADTTVRAVRNLAYRPEPVPWMSALTQHSQGLEVAHFPRNHSFVYRLAQRYADRYLAQARLKRPLVFRFQQELAFTLKASTFKTWSCPDCPALVSELAEELVVGSRAEGGHHYGTLVYDVRVQVASEVNLGDEVQGFPGLQFLPYVDMFLERDRMNTTSTPSSPPVLTFFNAWWGADDALWPPAENIEPLLVSMHIGEDMYPQWTQHLDYLKDKQPVGCRDHSTLDFLQAHGVNAYFSGCMTLLLSQPNMANQRTDTIYLVDLTDEILFLLPVEIQMRAVQVSHAYWGEDKLDNYARYTEAYDRLTLYGSAKLVVTQRIHCALPCVAMGTPVIFVDFPGLFGATSSKSSPRTAGLTPMFHTLDLYTTSREQAVNWLQNFPWDQPPPNPNLGLAMRLRATLWSSLRSHQRLQDSARRFGLLPVTRLSSTQRHNSSRLLFHVVVRSQPASHHSSPSWRVWRCLESVLYHHPLAEVRVYSSNLQQEDMSVLTESGYQVQVQDYSLQQLLETSPAKSLATQVSVENSGDLLGLLLLYHHGGVYLNSDTVLVRSLDSLPNNTLSYRDSHNHSLSSSVMLLEKGHPFLQTCLTELGKHSKNLANHLSVILTRMWKARQDIKILPYHAFHMFERPQVIQMCFDDTSELKLKRYSKILADDAYGVFISNIYTRHRYSVLKPGTLCSRIFNSYCTLCNNIY